MKYIDRKTQKELSQAKVDNFKQSLHIQTKIGNRIINNLENGNINLDELNTYVKLTEAIRNINSFEVFEG